MNVLYSLTPVFLLCIYICMGVLRWMCSFMRRHFPDWQFPTFFPQDSTRLVQRFPQIFVDRCDPRVDSTCGGTIYFCWFFDRTSMPQLPQLTFADFHWYIGDVTHAQKHRTPWGGRGKQQAKRVEGENKMRKEWNRKTKYQKGEMGKLNTKRVKWKQNAQRVKWEHGQGVVMVWLAVCLCHN